MNILVNNVNVVTIGHMSGVMNVMDTYHKMTSRCIGET